MSTFAKFILALVVCIILAGTLAISYVSAYNYGNQSEQLIIAKHKDNQNVLSKYTMTVREMVQVPDMYTADLRKVIEADMSGRYGPDGSTATMQWIKERNLPFDSSLYMRLQNTIEAGRFEFANNQTQLLDMKRSYRTALNSFWRGKMLHLAGYPKVNLDDYNIIVAGEVTEKFRTGVDAPLELRKPAQ